MGGIKVGVEKSKVKAISIDGPDFVLILIDGERLIIPNGVVNATQNPNFFIAFEDGEVITGQVILQGIEPLSSQATVDIAAVGDQDSALLSGTNSEKMLPTKDVSAQQSSITVSNVPIANSGGANPTLSLDERMRFTDSVTPEADDSSEDSSLVALWPLVGFLGAGAGIAIAASTASSESSSSPPGNAQTIPPAVSYKVTGVISLGPLVSDSAIVQVYSDKGVLLGSTIVYSNQAVDGLVRYSINVTNYSGALTVVLTKGAYISDVTSTTVDIPSQGFKSVAVADGVSTVVANITDMSNFVATTLGIAADYKVPVSADAVSATLAKFGSALGLDIHGETPVASVKVDGAKQSVSLINAYGVWDSAISFLSENNSLPSLTINMSASQIATAIKDALGKLTQDSPEKFTPTVINAFLANAETIPFIPPSKIANLTSDVLSSLTAAQLSAFTPSQIQGMDASALQGLSDAQLSLLAPSLTSDQINKLLTVNLSHTTAGPDINSDESVSSVGVVNVQTVAGSTWILTLTSAKGVVTKTGAGTGSAQAVTLTPQEVGALGDGAVTVVVSVTGRAGLFYATDSNYTLGNFTLDIATPTVSLAHTTNGDVINSAESNNAAGVVNVTAENNATWTLILKGANNNTVTKTGTGTGSAQVVALTAVDVTTLGQGAVTASISAANAAGKTATSATGGDFTIDTSAPNNPDLSAATDVQNAASADIIDANNAGAGVKVASAIQAPSESDIKSIYFTVGGVGFDNAHDKLMLDSVPISFSQSNSQGTLTLGGTSVSYIYTASSRELVVSKANGAVFTAAEITAVVKTIGYGTSNSGATEGVRTVSIVYEDAAGNKSANSTSTFAVNYTFHAVLTNQDAIYLNGSAPPADNSGLSLSDNTLNNGGDTANWTRGETLTLKDLGLSGLSGTPGTETVTFSNLTNIKVYYSTGAEILAGTAISLSDVLAGKVQLVYNQTNQASVGVNAYAEYELNNPSDKVNGSLLFTQQAAQMVIWGDESGNGGTGAKYAGGTGGNGTNGAGNNDVINGSAGADLIFGDGSGGGAGGGATISGRTSYTNGTAGTGGGGADIIHSGAGDDIVFGDGFSGSSDSLDGGYGGGGGGGQGQPVGSVNVSPGPGGVGAGSGGNFTNPTTTASNGGPTTLGFTSVDTTYNGITTAYFGGNGGRGVTADGNATAGNNYIAEVDDGANTALGLADNTGIVADAVRNAKSAFLAGPNSGSNMFSQTMGVGDDKIYLGDGNDYVMGGNGNDYIVGGKGNDIMYGRGGGAFLTRDDDTFVWQAGDEGASGALDIIRDFGGSTSGLSNATSFGTDKIDIAQLLKNYTSGSDLSQWVSVTYLDGTTKNITNQAGITAGMLPGSGPDRNSAGTLITIDIDGAGSGTTKQYIFLNNVQFNTTDVSVLKTNGVLVA